METRSINNSFEIFGYEEEEIERTTVWGRVVVTKGVQGSLL